MRISGKWYQTGQVATITADSGHVAHVKWHVGDTASRGDDSSDWWLAPAFVDLQVNGYAGHDFNRHWRQDQQDEAAAAFRAIVEQARQAGTGMLCPTVCTVSREQMTAALAAIRQARETRRWRPPFPPSMSRDRSWRRRTARGAPTRASTSVIRISTSSGACRKPRAG